ncbi:ketohexokinase-like [Schistocerca americana]|uniref:ketohexokinase-like n=1 Tax=Schistocerca americana TaxID=7009 RepID=UPI001F4FCD4A|nr:ketohexokinase-like [Schistocerca americana]
MAGNDLKFLCIGMVCLDELLYCKYYPIEDCLQRVLERRLRPGGNAGNNCKVLSELNAKCDLLGSLNINCTSGRIIKEHLESFGINLDKCDYIEGYEVPIATCIINEENGSRTSLYYSEEWPEVSYEAFLKVDLSQYSWIHLEMRNFDELDKIIPKITEWNSGRRNPVPVSLEMENYDERCMKYMSYGDVIFVSKDFARDLGYNSMSAALDGFYGLLKPGARLVIPWAEEGAAARSPGGVFFSPAFPPEKVVDTLGAGDTFCAGIMLALAKGRPLEQSLRFACQVAGAKVGIRGFKGLGEILRQRGVLLD